MALLKQTPKQVGQSRKPAQLAFEAARIGETKLGDWIISRISECDVESQLQLADARKNKPKLGTQEATLTEALKAEFTAKLIEHVIKRTIKKNKKERGQS